MDPDPPVEEQDGKNGRAKAVKAVRIRQAGLLREIFIARPLAISLSRVQPGHHFPAMFPG
jgi:hypothetical protein